jgi:putative transposase
MRPYRRHLPHQAPKGQPVFLTWNLKGAIPRQVAIALANERERLRRLPDREHESVSERGIRESKLLFAMADHCLDHSEDGPMLLRDDALARIVEESILHGASERYELFAWCVMSNHVHVLLTPKWELRCITQGIKGFSARQFNLLQGVVGRIVWQDESYDRWARDEEEFYRIIAYIENNPVAADLCKSPADWPRSSARFRPNWPPGQAWTPP